MRLLSTLALPLACALIASACADPLEPAVGRLLGLQPDAVLPRASTDAPARIPFHFEAAGCDVGAFQLDLETRDDEIVVTARGANRRGVCAASLVAVTDTLVLPAIVLREPTTVRFRQPGGVDSLRVVFRSVSIVTP